MLSDKEVGELWAKCTVSSNPAYAFEMKNLIRKLVEERAVRKHSLGSGDRAKYIAAALRDFGIDPETFK